MFMLQKEFRFEAGHELVHHDGKCKNPHGHSYLLTVTLQSQQLVSSGPKTNMVTDFSDISKAVKPMIETYLDHKWLNETLESDSPSAEFIAKWVYDHLKDKLPHLHSITIAETETSRVIYLPLIDHNTKRLD